VWSGGHLHRAVGRRLQPPLPGLQQLILYTASQASCGKLRLLHYSGAQITCGQTVAWAGKPPGDLIFFTQPGVPFPRDIYTGDGEILRGHHTRDKVRYGTVSEFAGEA
jgi:hypothetical protein